MSIRFDLDWFGFIGSDQIRLGPEAVVEMAGMLGRYFALESVHSIHRWRLVVAWND